MNHLIFKKVRELVKFILFFTISSQKFRFIFTLFTFTNILIFTPGIFSNDSLGQLSEAKQHLYTSTHSPVMSLMIHYLYFLFQENGAFIINQVAYWLTNYFFLNFLFKEKYWWLCLIPFFPPIFLLSLTVWKDTQMVLCLFAGVTGLLYYIRQPSNKVLLGIMILLCYATLVRFNSIFSVLPIVFYFFYVLFESKKLSIKRQLIFCTLSAMLFVGGVVCVKNVIYKHFEVQTATPLGYILLWDVSGIYHETGNFEQKLPHFVKCSGGDKCSKWVEAYTPYVPEICWLNEIDCNVHNSYESKELFKYWFNVVKQYPLVYLSNRLRTARLEWFSENTPWPYHSYLQNSSLGGRFEISYIAKLMLNKYYQLQSAMDHLRIYQYGTYFVLSVLLLCVLILKLFRTPDLYTQKAITFPVMLLISGLFNSIPLIFIAGTEYRYYIWSILSLILSILILSKKSELEKLKIGGD